MRWQASVKPIYILQGGRDVQSPQFAAWLVNGVRLYDNIGQWQYFALVSEKVVPILDKSLRDTVEVLQLICFKILEDLFKSVDEAIFLFA